MKASSKNMQCKQWHGMTTPPPRLRNFVIFNDFPLPFPWVSCQTLQFPTIKLSESDHSVHSWSKISHSCIPKGKVFHSHGKCFPFPWEWSLSDDTHTYREVRPFPLSIGNIAIMVWFTIWIRNMKPLTNYAWEWSLFDNLGVGDCGFWLFKGGRQQFLTIYPWELSGKLVKKYNLT